MTETWESRRARMEALYWRSYTGSDHPSLDDWAKEHRLHPVPTRMATEEERDRWDKLMRDAGEKKRTRSKARKR